MVDRWRAILLGNRAEQIGELAREVARMRAALQDPEFLRPAIQAAVQAELRSVLGELATEIAAAVRDASQPPPAAASHLLGGWRASLPRTVARAGAICGLALLATASAIAPWEPHIRAAAESEGAVPASALALSAPRAVVLEQRYDGFGLGQARLADGEIAREVRRRLAACPELAGSAVSFSVREGWVWLRGETTESGRAAAERALAGLAPGIFVVNQIEVVRPPDRLAAE